MARVIPALTLWQPWASLIALGLKPYETRPRPAPRHLIGRRIAIHAALRRPQWGEVTPEIHHAMASHTGNPLWFDLLPYGAVVCLAVLDAIFPAPQVTADPFGDYRPGRWAWRLADIHPLRPPVPARGARLYGWPWDVPPEVELWPPAVAPRRDAESG